MKSLKKILSTNLIRLRTERDWTQEQVAEIAGCDQSTVQKWEYGTRFPRPEQFEKLCEAFQVSMAGLLEMPDSHTRNLPSINESLKVICHELGFEAPRPLKIQKQIPDLSQVPIEILKMLASIKRWDLAEKSVKANLELLAIKKAEEKKQKGGA